MPRAGRSRARKARVLQRDRGLVAEVLQAAAPISSAPKVAAGDVADREHPGHPAADGERHREHRVRARPARPAPGSPRSANTRGSARTSGVETAAPSRTASPAISSSPGMTVPARKTPSRRRRRPPRAAPRPGRAHHRTDTVPPSSVRIPSAMCRPTLAPSSDCTEGPPHNRGQRLAASRRAVCSRAIHRGLVALDAPPLGEIAQDQHCADHQSVRVAHRGPPLSSMGRTCPSRRTSRVARPPGQAPVADTHAPPCSRPARESPPRPASRPRPAPAPRLVGAAAGETLGGRVS